MSVVKPGSMSLIHTMNKYILYMFFLFILNLRSIFSVYQIILEAFAIIRDFHNNKSLILVYFTKCRFMLQIRGLKMAAIKAPFSQKLLI